jgi:2-hydroxychromene-2-carboxylate isomerase
VLARSPPDGGDDPALGYSSHASASAAPKAAPTQRSLELSEPIEFWCEFASNYSYLSVMRIEQEGARLDVPIRWRSFLLGPIFKSFGWSTSPFVLQPSRNKGIFGAPTFFVGDEMFWGNDRLDDAFALCRGVDRE